MVQIERCGGEYRAAFTDMFVSYSVDDLRMQEEDPRLTAPLIREKIAPFFLRQAERGLSEIRIAVDGGIALGFAVFQIDRPGSDWCKRPGWGFIREFYVEKLVRREGIGRLLAARAEETLREMGARRLYLTTKNAGTFWEACGYTQTGGQLDNGQWVYEKEI